MTTTNDRGKKNTATTTDASGVNQELADGDDGYVTLQLNEVAAAAIYEALTAGDIGRVVGVNSGGELTTPEEEPASILLRDIAHDLRQALEVEGLDVSRTGDIADGKLQMPQPHVASGGAEE